VSKPALSIKSQFHDYQAHFTNGIDNHELEVALDGRTVHFIVDANVSKLHKDRIQDFAKAATFIEVEAEEEFKTIRTSQSIMLTLLNNNISKSDVVVVVGGGLTQDIGAFVANTLKRGLNWYFLPTTLLAMCDSCIGSKYGINLAGFKNQVGGFWPPSRIFIDLEYVKTSQKEHMIAGIGEILKVHLISGEEDFNKIEEKHHQILEDDKVLKYFILRSLEIKKVIVEKDEFDKDYRHILNYGHTFGHGIESYTNNQVPHGIGVTIGMEIANFISMKKGYLSEAVFNQVSSLLRQYIPYKDLDFSDHKRMFDALRQDKKFDGKNLNVILCKGIGKIVKDKIALNEEFLTLIDAYKEYYKTIAWFRAHRWSLCI